MQHTSTLTIIENTQSTIGEKHIKNFNKTLEQTNHLLLVENDIDVLTNISKKLSTHFKISTALNGIEAIEELKKAENINLVITNYSMPIMGGVDLCKFIRKHSMLKHLPIIMLATYAQEEHQMEGLEAGIDVFIPQRIEVKILIAQIKTLITNRKLLTEQIHQENYKHIKKEILLNNTNQDFLDAAITIVKKNMENPEFSTEVFCHLMNISQSTLYRKLKSLT